MSLQTHPSLGLGNGGDQHGNPVDLRARGRRHAAVRFGQAARRRDHSSSCPEAIKRRANSYEHVPVADAGLAKYWWS